MTNESNPAAMQKPWMIYGANGYTGELIAREAARRGLSPVLAGRNREAVESLARALKLQSRVFDLADADARTAQLQGMALVLNCAGPFSATAAPMMDACLAAGAHYLDITGEVDVLENVHALDARAKAAGVALCPGVGFDVIPTDCLAAALKRAMPDATHLALGFDTRSGVSPGTAKTMVEGFAQGSRMRRDGKIIAVPMAHEVRRIDFGAGEKQAMTILWGDIASAYHSTGIPNIQVFVPASPRMVARARRANRFRPLLGMQWVQRLIKSRIGRKVQGPSDEQRRTMPTHVWGEVRNARGECITARVRTANGYSLTIEGALHVAGELLAHPHAPGAYTPSRLLGETLVSRLPGSGAIEIDAMRRE